MKFCILLIILFPFACGFLKIPFGSPFSIKDNEFTKKITYRLPEHQENILNKINGFHGIIGPNVNINNITSLFDLFFDDGIIQGLFFDNGELTFVKNFVRTEKLLYEEKNGKIPKHMLSKIFFYVLNQARLLPNLFGLANTALLNVNNSIFALYERDSPYLLNIDFDTKSVNTIKKIDMKIPSFSAHSKYTDVIDTIDYQIVNKGVLYSQLREDFTLIKSKLIHVDYIPVIHDFLLTETKMIFFDSPICFDLMKITKSSMPVFLDKSQTTRIKIVDRDTLGVDTFFTDESFYNFHFAGYTENDRQLEIYASLYDYLDFSEMNISGKYRKIVVDKITKKVEIIRNAEFEKMDLEFPIRYHDKIAFRFVENKTSTGIIVCKNLQIIKKISFPENFVSGEPSIHWIDNKPFLIVVSFCVLDNNISNLIIINMDTYEKIEVPLNVPIQLGFHSIFIDNTPLKIYTLED